MTAEAATFKPVTFQMERKSRTYSLEEYLRREARSVDKHEFVQGKIVKMPYSKGPHNIISANIIAQLVVEFSKLEKNFIVFTPDQKVYFPDLDEGVYADALAVAEKPQYWDTEQLLLINPLLVVEVLSKSTARYDRTSKFNKYKTLESFREYVLVRQDECYAEAWFRERPGLWHETIVTDPAGELPLQSVGISLTMQRIYRNVELAE
jgi:Uma2 family endonuclease